MTAVFLDTSALYASANLQEPRHVDCRDMLTVLMRQNRPLVTTELVMAELHALTLTRVGPQHALGLVERIGASLRIVVEPVDRVLRDQGIDLLRTRPDRRYSLTDAISFVVMRGAGIETAFTLDNDFAAEGFALLPAA